VLASLQARQKSFRVPLLAQVQLLRLFAIVKRLDFSLPSEAREESEFSLRFAVRTLSAITFSSSHTTEARELKIAMHISHLDGSKVTNQIFDILPRS